MGSQGFRNIAGNPFVYQEDVRSAAFGLDLANTVWKLSVKATPGALPTNTAQLTIDPATNGNVTIDPNGSGNLVVTSGNVSLTAGNLALPTTSSTVGQILINGSAVFHTYGTNNVFLGTSSGNFSLTSQSCMGFGFNCLTHLTNGNSNTAIGVGALHNTAGGAENVSIGNSGGYTNTSGTNNVILGAYTAYTLATGSRNILIGSNDGGVVPYGSGGNYTGAESSNICIHNYGVLGESNKIRIGTSGSGAGQQNACYIAGIYGVTPGGTLNIALVDSNGQLGSVATLSPALGGKMTWTTATADATAAVNTGYLIKHATPATKLVITLPAAAAVYDEIEINGYTAGMWKVAQNASQVIHFESTDTTTGTGGYIEATNKYDCVKLRCVVTNNEWLVVSNIGVISVV